MGKRSAYQRTEADIKPGRIELWNAGEKERDEIALKVQYRGNGAHKTYTSPTGEWTPSLRRGKSVCSKFAPEDWPRLLLTLQAAIRVGGVHKDFERGYPTRVWAYINGKLHEARLHNPLLGEYHG